MPNNNKNYKKKNNNNKKKDINGAKNPNAAGNLTYNKNNNSQQLLTCAGVRTQSETASIPNEGHNLAFFFKTESFVYAVTFLRDKLFKIDPEDVAGGFTLVTTQNLGDSATRDKMFLFNQRRNILFQNSNGIKAWRYFDEEMGEFVDGGTINELPYTQFDTIRDEFMIWAKFITSC